MKNTSKFYAFAAMIAAAACLCSFASCNKAGEIVETDREEGTTAMYYSIGLSAWVGAGMGVDYEGCAITVSNRSEEGTLFIEKLEGGKILHGLGTFIFLSFYRVFRQESASRRNALDL